jgi:hypothetical protein
MIEQYLALFLTWPMMFGVLGVVGIGMWGGGAMYCMPDFREIAPSLWVALILGVLSFVVAFLIA